MGIEVNITTAEAIAKILAFYAGRTLDAEVMNIYQEAWDLERGIVDGTIRLLDENGQLAPPKAAT